MKRRFPTKAEFFAWWNGKKDRRPWKGRKGKMDEFRNEQCPIARYLRAHGHPEAFVSSVVWYHDDAAVLPSMSQRLPKWAREAIVAFDAKVYP